MVLLPKLLFVLTVVMRTFWFNDGAKNKWELYLSYTSEDRKWWFSLLTCYFWIILLLVGCYYFNVQPLGQIWQFIAMGTLKILWKVLWSSPSSCENLTTYTLRRDKILVAYISKSLLTIGGMNPLQAYVYLRFRMNINWSNETCKSQLVFQENRHIK